MHACGSDLEDGLSDSLHLEFLGTMPLVHGERRTWPLDQESGKMGKEACQCGGQWSQVPGCLG